MSLRKQSNNLCFKRYPIALRHTSRIELHSKLSRKMSFKNMKFDFHEKCLNTHTHAKNHYVIHSRFDGEEKISYSHLNMLSNELECERRGGNKNKRTLGEL